MNKINRSFARNGLLRDVIVTRAFSNCQTSTRKPPLVRKPILKKNKSKKQKRLILKNNSDLEIREKHVRFYNKIAFDKSLNTLNASKDEFGNIAGNQYDLAIDNAFSGKNIVILQLCDFSLYFVQNALKEKGFNLTVYSISAFNQKLPQLKEFKQSLLDSCELWIISDLNEYLNEEYLDLIEEYFKLGGGIFILGDSEPFFTDANKILKRIFNCTFKGDFFGDNVIHKCSEKSTEGKLAKDHLLLTGIECLYDGLSMSRISNSANLEPVMRGSSNNLVIACYNKNKRRAVIDGSFTRLFCSWKTAGTARYIKNVAAWLANVENL